jgi:hypothetical protein
MRHLPMVLVLCLTIATCLTPRGALGGQSPQTAPETLSANALVLGQDASSTAMVTIRIEHYISEGDRTKILDGLKFGGYPGFLPVFRKAPEIGSVEMNGRKVVARWAHQVPTANGGRTISVVTDGPLFFVGGGGVDSKPRAGFDLAILLFDVNSTGVGTGTMAAAARVRPGGPTGVQIDDYSEKPVKLVTVQRAP